MSKSTLESHVSVEMKWVQETKKGKPWYSKSPTAGFALVGLATIDLAGFLQGFAQDIDWNSLISGRIETEIFTIASYVVMVMGFLVAFEIATIYMAYAFSIKLYGYDRQAVKIIGRRNKRATSSKAISTSMLGWISFAAFVLGAILNAIFRIGILDGKATFAKPGHQLLISNDWAITIIMIFLPIITSIMNFVIGCFTFDPLLFELNGIAKEIVNLSSKVSSIENLEQSAKDELKRIKKHQTISYKERDAAIMRATGLRTTLRTRMYEEQMRSI